MARERINNQTILDGSNELLVSNGNRMSYQAWHDGMIARFGESAKRQIAYLVSHKRVRMELGDTSKLGAPELFVLGGE